MDYQNPTSVLKIPQLDLLNQKLDNLITEIRDQKADTLSDYISKNEFMDTFGIKHGLFYRLLNKNVLKTYRINRKVYLKRSEVDNALQQGLLK